MSCSKTEKKLVSVRVGNPSAVILLYQKEKTNHNVCKQLMRLLMLYLKKLLALIMKWTITFSDYINLPSWAIASNRPTEALAFVISFAFVYSHHKHSKYLGRELKHGPIASVISFFWLQPCPVYNFTNLKIKTISSFISKNKLKHLIPVIVNNQGKIIAWTEKVTHKPQTKNLAGNYANKMRKQ